MGGELSSLREQLKVLEKDLAEFKDVYKRYADQLVKVKVRYKSPKLPLTIYKNFNILQLSDLANNDLEKYAKALDKYAVLFDLTFNNNPAHDSSPSFT